MIMNPEEKHINPDLGLGDVFKYSALVGSVVAEASAVHNLPVGQSQTLPNITTWLPDGHEYVFELKATRKA
jgi:hypothetical protein